MRVIETGAAIQLANGLYGYFITLTAPGNSEHLRWYQGKKPRHRTACDCHDHGRTDGEWNRLESSNWNRLRTSLARDRQVIFAGSVETQKRGLLHRHVVLFADRVLTHAEVQSMAIAAGYGCVLDLEPLQSAQKAARYLAKYVTKSTAERADVPWTKVTLDTDTGELLETPVRATYRLWSSSRKWGCTMKQLQQDASRQAAQRAMYLRELQADLATDQLVSAAAPSSSDPPI